VLAALDRSLDRKVTTDAGETKTTPVRRCGGNTQTYMVRHARLVRASTPLYVPLTNAWEPGQARP